MLLKLSHPTGNANVRAVAEGLLSANMLASYYTCLAVFPDTLLYRLSGINGLSDIRRRQLTAGLRNVTETNPWFEIARLISLKFDFKSLVKHEVGLFSVDGVYQNHDKWVAKQLHGRVNKKVDGVYAYEDGAMYTFSQAKREGIRCLYDLPIGYWKSARKLMEIEIEKWPEWKATLTGFKDSEVKLERKDEELRLADHIFVASSFTANTLNDFSGKLAPISIVPYGFPAVSDDIKDYKRKSNQPLKILFVGGLSQRKGIANLFSAVEKFGSNVDLTIVGRRPVDNCVSLNSALSKHQWIPSLSHREILTLMKSQDLLIFPSLFEGFGLVITEAMSQGTPVITTERTAGPDLINHGKNGWIIEAGSTRAIEEIVEYLLLNPQEIEAAGVQAREAAMRRPWEVYGEELCLAIDSL